MSGFDNAGVDKAFFSGTPNPVELYLQHRLRRSGFRVLRAIPASISRRPAAGPKPRLWSEVEALADCGPASSGSTANAPWIATLHVARSSNAPTVTEIPMYDQSKLSELIRFARVNLGATVIDVYPGKGDWTRLFSDVVGPEGRVYGFVPTEIADLKGRSSGA